MGFGPQVVDLDGDGYRDVLSGSWPGEIYLFRGLPGGRFAAPIMLRHRTGEPINIGGGVEEQAGGRLLIRGKAEFKKTATGTVVVYRGKEYPTSAKRPVAVTGTASVAHATDWDGDGDLDLLVGDIRGQVFLVPNEGSRSSLVFGAAVPLSARGRPIRVPGGDAGPFAADWDLDGDLDLLVGTGAGSVLLYRNVGSRTEPVLWEAEELVPPSSRKGAGMRAKVCVADWNDDGLPDLLVGDFASRKRKGTPDEEARWTRLRAELQGVRKELSRLARKLRSGPPGAEERARIRARMKELGARSRELLRQLPRQWEYHGHVWFYRRLMVARRQSL